MFLTRRTFVQSSLAASLAVAAEATRAVWLLKPDNPIRIALAGLGPSAAEHLALFAAVPGAHIVALADPSQSNLQAALAQLSDLGLPRPALYPTLSNLLHHPAIDAVSLPADESSKAFSLRELLATGLPILADVPPRNLSYSDFLALQKAPVRFRTTDRLYPGASSNIHAQWKRPATELQAASQTRSARLILERRLPPPQLRAVLIAALEALLDSHATPAAQLLAWSQDLNVIEFTRSSTILHVHLPRRIAHFDRLEVDLLPRSSGASTLWLGQPSRTMEVPIWRVPDSRSSLRTVMAFLGQAGTPFAKHTQRTTTYTPVTATEASLSFAAAWVVDRALPV